MATTVSLIFLLAWFISIGVFTAAWLVYLIQKNPAIVDVFWSLSLLVIASVFVTIGSSGIYYRFIFYSLILVWGLRLAIYLLRTRILRGHRDSRYEEMQERWKTFVEVKFLLTYLFQATLAAGVSMGFLGLVLPFGKIGWAFIVGIGFVFIGLVGEILSDRTLQQFKRERQLSQKSQNKESQIVCQVGVWKWSRHPNLFFEWLIWVGFACMSLGAPYGWIAWSSPMILLVVLLTLSIPISEKQSLRSKGEVYRAYQRTTNTFIPLPWKLF